MQMQTIMQQTWLVSNMADVNIHSVAEDIMTAWHGGSLVFNNATIKLCQRGREASVAEDII
jgi:hypothetical protein